MYRKDAGVAGVLIGAFCLLPAVAMADGELRGRLHADYAIHDEALPGDGAFLLRRARLGLDGEAGKDWSYRIEFDFSDSRGVEAKDIKVGYEGLSLGDITVGHFKPAFGLENGTSSNNLTFIERSLPSLAFGPSRRIGAGMEIDEKGWFLEAMAYDGRLERNLEVVPQQGVGARLSVYPRLSKKQRLHFGVSAMLEEPEDADLGEARFRAHPESRASDVFLASTGRVGNVEAVSRTSLEMAWMAGPFSLQGEWMQAGMQRTNGEPNLSFGGYYVAASWFLTGEDRRYSDGSYRSVKPRRAIGAWELAARFSHIDLNDGAIEGGVQSNTTLGINWYVGRNVRLMANTINVEADRRGVETRSTLHLFRTQIAF